MDKKSFLTLAAYVTIGISSALAQSPGIYPPPPPDSLQEQLLKSQLRPVRVPTPVPRLLPASPEIALPPQIQVRHEPWQLKEVSRDQQTWISTEIRVNPITGKEARRKVEIIEVGSGLNFRDAQGNWQPTREEFSALPDGGFIATDGPHQLRLEPNINSVTAIDFVSADGLRLRNGPLAVGYYDPRDGRNVVLGLIRDAAGKQTGPNEITYFSAFEGIEASIRITYHRSGVSADLILDEEPPAPEELGLSDDARLELYTEFHPETVDPLATRRLLREEKDAALRAQMMEPDFADDVLDFGGYHMGTGAAFQLETAKEPLRIPVAKRFSRMDGRPILIEAVEWKAAKPLLGALPPARKANQLQALLAPRSRRGNEADAARSTQGTVPLLTSGATSGGASANLARAGSRQFPARKTPQAVSPLREARLDSPAERRGFVLDYSLVTGATNMTFETDRTYFVKANTYLYGNTVFEGAVIKYTNSAAGPALRLRGTVEFKTSDYNPLICTAQDDDTVGETLPWSTGNPWAGYYGNPAIEVDSYTSGQPAKLAHLRISHANTAISFFTGTGHELKHAQIVHANTAFTPYYADVRLRNTLVHKTDRVVSGSGSGTATMRFEHLTASEVNHLNYSSASTSLLTNSLLVAVTNTGSYSGANNASATTSAATFNIAGAGAHYLLNGAYRAQGTATGLDPNLLKDIRARTTQPPLVLTNGALLASITLHPRAELRYASGAAPDLGYHYPIIDHVMGGLRMTNITLTLNPGVVLSTVIPVPAGFGLVLADGAKLIAEGSPTSPVVLVRHNLVQEQASDAWKWKGPSLVYPWWTPSTGTETRLRFTKASIRWSDEWLWAYGMPGTFVLRDSEFHGCATYNFSFTSVGITNCLFSRTYFSGDLSPSTGAALRNNLFVGGTFEIYPAPDTTARDNAFDRTAIPFQENITNSHNAYVTGAERLLPTNATDKVLASMTYQKGALGSHYMPSGSVLINAGSQGAPASGLYHYCSTTNQALEASSTVDIGLHYVVVNGSGQPVDTDADYVANYLEDVNGNGVQDAGEFSHTAVDADNDGDGLSNYQESLLSYSPVIRDTDGDGVPDANEDFDGDLLTDNAEFNGGFGSDPLVMNSMAALVPDAVFFFNAVVEFPLNNGVKIQLPPTFPGSGLMRWNLVNLPQDEVWTSWVTSDLAFPFVRWADADGTTAPYFENINPDPALTQSFGFIAAGIISKGGNLADEDKDGIADGWETAFSRSNPTNPDSDGDDYSDGPALPDTDTTAGGVQAPSGNSWKGANDAFPFDQAAWRDTDGDGMPDSVAPGIATTLIEDVDDDNDGIPDAIEQQRNSDPLDANSRPVPTWFVNLNAAPNGDGSKQLPFQTIQAAIDAADANSYEIIQVAAGTYSETPHFNGKKLQVRSEKGTEDTIINGPASDWSVVFNGDVANGPETENTWLEGFTIRNGGWGGIAFFNGSRAVVVNCVIQSNGAQAPVGGGGIHCSASSPTIINCKILSNGSSSKPGGGLYAFGASAPRLSHCTFNGNLRSANGGQIHARDTSKVTNINCVVWSTAADAEIVTAGSGQVNVSYSTVRGGYAGLLNLSSDPLLETSGRLVRTSPCKDRGTTNGVPGYGWLTRYDQDGEARLQDSPVNLLFNADIGSDEFVYRLAFPLVQQDANGNDIPCINCPNPRSQVDEASGVAYLGSITVGNEQHAKIAVIDDEVRDTLYIYELDAFGQILPLNTVAVNIRHPNPPGTEDVSNDELNDVEGITFDRVNRFLYLTTSHTKRNRYRNVDHSSDDPVLDPPSNDYDRRRSIMMRLQFDANFNPLPNAANPTRTVWQSENQVIPFNTGFDANNGLFAFIRQQLNAVGAPYTAIDRGNNVLIAWNTVNKFGTPQDGIAYQPNTSIPGGGTALANVDLSLVGVNALALGGVADTRILAAVNINDIGGPTDRRIARMSAAGASENAFGAGMPGINGEIHAMAVQTDGKIVIVGDFTSVGGVARGRIARLNSDGTLDTAFATGAGANNTVYAVAVQTDGRIVIGGNFTSVHGSTRTRIARLNAAGTVHSGALTAVVNAPVRTIAIQADGKILIGGDFTMVGTAIRSRVARFNANASGSHDTTFVDSGVNASVRSVLQQTDGNVLIGGDFTTVQGSARNGIALLSATGTLNTTFGNGLSGASAPVRTLGLLSSGQILAGGDFITMNGTARNRVARLNTDGTLDTAFGAGQAGPNDLVRALAVQADGSIVLVGDFTMVNGTARDRLARLNPDGSLDSAFNPYLLTGFLNLPNFGMANNWYHFKVWTRDGSGGYHEGPVASCFTDGVPKLFINEFFSRGTGTDWLEVYNPAGRALNMANISPLIGPLRFRIRNGSINVPANSTIPPRGYLRFIRNSNPEANEAQLGDVFNLDPDWDRIYLESTALVPVEVDNYLFEKDQELDNVTEGRAWDGGPRGRVFNKSLGLWISEGARFGTPSGNASPYPPTSLRGSSPFTPPSGNHHPLFKHLYATPDPDRTTIYLEWAAIGLTPAVWQHSPKQHDFHSINIEGMAYRSPTEMIIGLRSPLSVDRKSGNALYFRVTNVRTSPNEFLPDAGGWAGGVSGIAGPQQLNLNNQGIRDLVWCPNGLLDGQGQTVLRYLIIGGPANGGPLEKELVGEKFSLYSWTGNMGDAPVRVIEDLRPYTIRPEGVDLIQVNGLYRVLFTEDRFKAQGYGTRNAIHWPVSILGSVQ